MLRLTSRGRWRQVVFTDEKIFTVERVHNHQNDRQLFKKSSQMFLASKIIQRAQFPASIMVWGGVCAAGKTPLVFIDRNDKINSEIYQQRVLKGVLAPWAQSHFNGNSYMLQQNWAKHV